MNNINANCAKNLKLPDEVKGDSLESTPKKKKKKPKILSLFQMCNHNKQ